MNEQRDMTALELLSELTRQCIGIIISGLRAKRFTYIPEPVPYSTIEGFSYGEKGPTYTGSSHGSMTRKNWGKAAFDIGDLVFKLPAFSDAEHFIGGDYNYSDSKNLLEQYCFQLFHLILERNNVIDLKAVNHHQDKLVAFLNDQPIPGLATAYLSGIIMESPEFVISPDIRLRQSQSTDLEQKRHFSEEMSFIHFPSAVMEVKRAIKKEEMGYFHEVIKRYVRLFRLFKVGSVNSDFYNVKFDTIKAPHSMFSGNPPQYTVWRSYFLKTSEEAFLLQFLERLNFTYPQKPDYLSTGFDRYSEAVLEDVSIERRIANAIMGIEALLSNDNVELVFRLSSRAAKLLACLGLEALPIKADLIKAYKVRSKYAHGGFIDPKERKTKDYDGFAELIINYLRMILIIFIRTGLSKDNLILLLDDAMIDGKKSTELFDKISPLAEFFSF